MKHIKNVLKSEYCLSFRASCFGFRVESLDIKYKSGSLELLQNLRMPCLYSSGCNVHNSRTVVVFVYICSRLAKPKAKAECCFKALHHRTSHSLCLRHAAQPAAKVIPIKSCKIRQSTIYAGLLGR